jgi:Ran GTPase-activating protein (RanGAP) involved in mRNA processing and transport
MDAENEYYLNERLRANDPDYWEIDTCDLYASELLNLTAALENNTVVSQVFLHVCGFTEESANAMGNFLRASNSLEKVVLCGSITGPGVLRQQRLILCILFRALLCSKSVKKIFLVRIDFSACDKVFDDHLACTESLQKLAIFWTKDARLNPTAATTIANSLTRSVTVKELRLIECPESSLIPFLSVLQDHSVLDSLYLEGVQSLTGLDPLLQSKRCGISTLVIESANETTPTTWDSRSLPSLEPLSRGIQRNTLVTDLTIAGCSLGLDAAAQLKSILYKNTVLQHLNVRGTGLGSAGLAEIAAGLYRNTTLKHLNLSDNDLGDLTSAKTLKDLLRRNKSLTNLTIEDIPFGRTLGTVDCIAQGIRGSTSLQLIDLSNCMLGDRGISALANDLGSRNKTLKTLFLCNNQITSIGLRLLLDLVAEKLPIANLSLNRNPFGRAGSNLLADALGRNRVPNLKEIFFEDCGVDDEGLQEIASALVERNNTLELIALEGNVFSEAGVLALAGSLPNIKTLDYIDLTWNGSVSASMPILMEGLRKNKSLREIVFCGGSTGEWTQELEFLQYRNRFHRLIPSPESLDAEKNMGVWSNALASVATLPDVIFHALCSKPQLVRSAGESKKRKREGNDDDEGDDDE